MHGHIRNRKEIPNDDKHFDPKTHTHTHKTSLTNFIFQKQVKTV